MNIQHVRTWTTGIVHGSLWGSKDALYLFTGGMDVISPLFAQATSALRPWLQSRLQEPRFWNGKFDPEHVGEIEIAPMTPAELDAFKARLNAEKLKDQ